MKVQIALILIIPIFGIAKDIVGDDLNYKSLMKKYFLLCGPEYFCFEPRKTYQWDLETSKSFKNQRLCPECYCDPLCLMNGNCCPDLFFSLPRLECVNRTIIKGTDDNDRNSQFSALMVTSCPKGSDPDVALKCTNLNDTRNRLLHFPITDSKGFHVNYFNRHCAKCHNVTEFQTWTLDINCSLFADFNYLSTVEEVIAMATDRKCTFQAYKELNGSEFKEENCYDINENRTLYTKCNETGEWKQYDRDVRYACESSYKRSFRIFKNIFCYMCNPSAKLYFTRIVDQCNETGQWKTVDKALESGCKDLPHSPHTLPYKNIFCYMCNKANNSSRQFVDIDGEVNESVVDDSYFRFKYILSVNQFDLKYFDLFANRAIAKNPSLNSTISTPFSMTSFRNKHGSTINLTSLLAFKAAVDGHVNFCKGRYFDLPHSYRKCSCHLDCVLGYGHGCCDDIALEIPATCISDFELSGTSDIPHRKRPYLVIDGCFGESKFQLFEQRCRTHDTASIFNLLPVIDERGISYKNYYCLLCNFYSQSYIRKLNGNFSLGANNEELDAPITSVLKMHLDKFNSSSRRYTFYNIEVHCQQYLDFNHILTAGHLIDLAKQMKCRVRYRNTSSISLSCLKSDSKCSNSPNWNYLDNDVKWACNEASAFHNYNAELPVRDLSQSYSEDFVYRNDTYNNVFCALCRPTRNFSSYIDYCPSYSLHNLYIDCLNLPSIYFYYPFKNKACAKCNNEEMYVFAGMVDVVPEVRDFRQITGLTWFPILRNLYSFTQMYNVHRSSSKKNCSETQIFDSVKSTCRDVKCYDGKFLSGSECIPLMLVTQNLKYCLRARAEISYSLKWPKEEVLDIVISIISQKLYDALQFDRGYISTALAEKYCNCSENLVSSILEVYLTSEIFIRSSVDRLKIEMSLLQFSNNTLLEGSGSTLSILISDISFENTYENNQIVKTHWEIDLNNTEKGSFIQVDPQPVHYESYHVSSLSSHVTSVVSEILLCQQIELNGDEYEIRENETMLYLSRIDMKILPSKYWISQTQTVRVCYNYLNEIGYFPSSRMMKKHDFAETTYKNRAVWIVSLTCTILSVLSICLSLVIYCLLPSLRTTSGKLMMLMMVSLLFTLIFFQLSSIMIHSKIGCLVVGFILHFSWLSVFFSMNSCNYLIFVIFVSKLFNPQEPKSKTLDRKLIMAIFYTFCVPFLFVVINVTISSFTKGIFSLGYGGRYCFIETKLSNIITFLFPVITVLLSNIVFFSFTTRAIRRAPNVKSNQKQRQEFTIYLRLTTVTGIAWILQIVDFFLPMSVFSFVASSIILLQGLFIFLAFAAKRRNFQLLWQQRRLHKQRRQPIPAPKEMEVIEFK